MPPQRNRRRKNHGGRNRTSSQSSVEIQVTQTEVSTPNQFAQPALVKPRSDFLGVLKSVSARGSFTPAGEEVFTVRQLCVYLTEYIRQKELYDPFNPLIVYCQEDPLGKVFGVEKFSRHEALKYVLKQCEQVLPRQKLEFTPPVITNQLPTPHYTTADTLKHVDTFLTPSQIVANPVVRPAGTVDEDVRPSKRPKHDSGSGESHQSSDKQKSPEAGTSRYSPDFTGILPLRRRQSSFSIVYNSDGWDGKNDWAMAVVQVEESGEESVYSVQSKETVLVESSSDDFWFLDDEEDDDDVEAEFSVEMNEQGISVEFNPSAGDPPFAEEYEIEEQSGGESWVEYDTDGSESPIEEIFVVYDASDEDFWADSESSDQDTDNTSDDEEICDADKWQCTSCKFVNTPLRRYCDKCWSLRANWVSDEDRSKPKSPKTLEKSEKNTDYFGIGHTRAESMETLPASDVDMSEFEQSQQLTKQYDSGIGGSICNLSQNSYNYSNIGSSSSYDLSSLPSSQESNNARAGIDSRIDGDNNPQLIHARAGLLIQTNNDNFNNSSSLWQHVSTKTACIANTNSDIEKRTIQNEGAIDKRMSVNNFLNDVSVHCVQKVEVNSCSISSDEEIVKSACSTNSNKVVGRKIDFASSSGFHKDIKLEFKDCSEEIVKSACSSQYSKETEKLSNYSVQTQEDGKKATHSQEMPKNMMSFNHSKDIKSDRKSQSLMTNSFNQKLRSSPRKKHPPVNIPTSPCKILTNSPRKSRSRQASESYQDLCTVCMVKPKEASIIHGKTGHQVCCYVCAKRLKRKGKHCPVCRRPIQKVIKNYLA